jgi:hypothetical protein
MSHQNSNFDLLNTIDDFDSQKLETEITEKNHINSNFYASKVVQFDFEPAMELTSSNFKRKPS